MKKGDKIVGIILLIVVVIALGATSIYKMSIKGSENIAVIKHAGKVIRTIDLNKVVESEKFTIKTDKDHYNIIEVKHNSISIIAADCPHKECVKSGSISNPGEMIVCLPYKLIINIQGHQDKSIDGGTF
ncbi:NusG domain II-containing protein [Clostridium algoriphilum]|uniref:NusG domain II-containing protein n=1 Tax=Clostridium algoriphilum TaxID=198347 RepID=UPI001CF44B1D|nr:NusG domain II-containing protein [Clostridium algoriphilum]MCB2293724.1 NusG domain II-containing protein [Clostridium algoriphilum]